MSRGDRVKNNVISLRFTSPQLDAIDNRARSSNLKRTVYAQNLINNGGILPKSGELGKDGVIYHAYLLLHQELRKQGHHLNQIAKAIDTANLEGRNLDGGAYVQLLSDIHEAHQKIAASIAKLEAGS